MYTTHLHTIAPPSKVSLLSELEILALENTLWYLREWSVGHRDAPHLAAHCCCGCAGVKYKRDRPGYEIDLIPAPIAFGTKVASCGTAAAVSAANHRAKEVEAAVGLDQAVIDSIAAGEGEGWDAYQDARARWRIRLVEQVPGLYHAIVINPDGQVDDPTKEMEPA